MNGEAVTEIDRPTDLSGVPSGATVPGITSTPGGVKIGVDITQPTAAQIAAPNEIQSAFLKSVPDGYGEKPWVQNFAKTENPLAEMFKSFENQQATISRKDGLKIPTADSPAESWAEFRKAMSIPEKAEEYAYQAPKAPDGLEQHYQADEKLVSIMREAAHKANVSQEGWKAITAAFDGYYADSLKEMMAQADNQLKEAESTFKKHYGEKTPQVLANLEKASSSAPDWAKPILNRLGPAAKAAVASLFNDFSNKYVREDKLDVIGAAPTNQTMSQSDYGDKYAELFAKVRETSRSPQSSEHIRAKAELAKLQQFGREVVFKQG
ncbi:MAG: hypothetical protein KGI50_06040 [Patescibacteria group bacterium]|nr:hypothetical protein [Patescibacteria group bacterium]